MDTPTNPHRLGLVGRRPVLHVGGDHINGNKKTARRI